jgi:hypothetical protein
MTRGADEVSHFALQDAVAPDLSASTALLFQLARPSTGDVFRFEVCVCAEYRHFHDRRLSRL